MSKLLLLLLTLLPFGVFASVDSLQILDLTDHWVGYTALILFVMNQHHSQKHRRVAR